MKKNHALVSIIFMLVLCSCFELEKNKRNNILGGIGELDTLTLYHNTDDCGKWGGDMYVMKIYQNSSKLLVCDLLVREMQCKGELKNIAADLKEVSLTKTEKLKIEECINDITRSHLDNDLPQELTGAYSYVRNSDQSLLIKDSGSSWKSFVKLVESLKKKGN